MIIPTYTESGTLALMPNVFTQTQCLNGCVLNAKKKTILILMGVLLSVAGIIVMIFAASIVKGSLKIKCTH